MRPLFHPAIKEITVEGILHALADPVRVAIYAQIVSSACAQMCSDFSQVAEKTVPKSTLSQHFNVLREAGLIRGERRGTQMLNTPRCTEIDTRFPGLIAAIMNAYTVQQKVKPTARKPKK